MKLFARLKKRSPNPFMAKLLAQAHLVVDGAQALVDYVADPSRDHAARVHKVEKQADNVRHALVSRLNHTFFTPIDREDLFRLSRTLDDVVDGIYAITREMHILRIEPNDHIQAMAALLAESGQAVYQAVAKLEHQPEIASRHALHILALENRMNTLYVRALAGLYDDLPIVSMTLKLHDIYRHMDGLANLNERVANLIHEIVVKSY